MAQRILVAYDASPQAHAALREAVTTHPDADITVMHVIDPREGFFWDPMDGGYYSEEAFDRAQESADELLARAESFAADHDVEVATVTEMGMAADAVVEYAESEEIDHIVVGSHGRTGVERFLLGSVAERIARRAPVTVTIVRTSDTETTS